MDCLGSDLAFLFVLARREDVQDEVLDIKARDQKAWQETQNL